MNVRFEDIFKMIVFHLKFQSLINVIVFVSTSYIFPCSKPFEIINKINTVVS